MNWYLAEPYRIVQLYAGSLGLRWDDFYNPDHRELDTLRGALWSMMRHWMADSDLARQFRLFGVQDIRAGREKWLHLVASGDPKAMLFHRCLTKFREFIERSPL
jgi:hypothetical protein